MASMLLPPSIRPIGWERTLLALWAFASAALVGGGVLLAWHASGYLLKNEMRAAATGWTLHVQNRLDDLPRVLSTGELTAADLNVLRQAKRYGGITGYRLFDRVGRIVLSSPGLKVADLLRERDVPNKMSPQLIANLMRDQTQVRFMDTPAGDRSPMLYGQVHVPVTVEGRIEGFVELWLDRDAEFLFTRSAFRTFACLLALLILLAATVPAALVWRTTREHNRVERRLHDLARNDPLTGLPNRTDLRKRLEDALSQLNSERPMIALFVLGLDRFKTVNDALGHPTGDELLREAAFRLRRNLRNQDAVARLGGDEFAVLQHDCHDPQQATRLALRLIDALAKPYDLKGRHVVIGASVGIVLAPQDGDLADDLLTKADIALDRAKGSGRSTHRFFEPTMKARLQTRHALEEDLRLALEKETLGLHYQPQVALDSGRVVGVEALLRWHHPRYGQMPPDEVVALAEETGLIQPLGAWALKEACITATSWPENIRVAVNISAVQFRDTKLIDLIEEALRISAIRPKRLELEITESAVMDHSQETIAKLRQIRALGIHLSMDDFGIGYSSLSRLRDLPFDRVKIDRSFVRGLASKRDDMAIVHAIITLGQRLEMDVVAEGVETDAQAAHLRLHGCEIAQGFYFGKPTSADDIGRMLATTERGEQVGGKSPIDLLAARHRLGEKRSLNALIQRGSA